MKKLSQSELIAFCNQMHIVLRSGISAIEGVSIMQEEAENEQDREILNAIYENISITGSLYEALDNVQIFPLYMLNFVKLGEESGRLDDVMESLTMHYQREEDIKRSVKNAITYPLVMIVMMVAVVVVLIVKVMPIFNDVFNELGSGVSGIALHIMNIGTILERYSIILITVLIVCLAMVLFLVCSKKGKQFLKNKAFKLFFMKKIVEKIAVARFSSGMAMALSSGLDIDTSLDMVGQLVEHPILQQKIKNCQDMLQEGESFSDAVVQNEIFSKMHSHLVLIGLRTGSADEVMQKIANQCTQEIDDRIQDIIGIVEPTLVAVLSVIIGLILLSVMLPLMGIMSSIS